MQCPVCNRPRVAQAARCACDYDFVHADPSLAIHRLAESVDAARGHRRLGIALLISLPITVILEAVVFGPQVMMVLGIAQAVGGAGAIAAGTFGALRGRRKLAGARALRQLPAARIVIR